MTDVELTKRVPASLDQLRDSLHLATSTDPQDRARRAASACRYGGELFQLGLTLGEVVQDYGDVCQCVTELAAGKNVPIAETEFRLLNLCVLEAVAGSATEWVRRREGALQEQETERLGRFGHELRNLLNTGVLAYESIKRGHVPIGGAMGELLGRSLAGLLQLVTRSLADVRLDARIERFERIAVADLLAEIELGASMQAYARGLPFRVSPVDASVAIVGDRQIVAAAIANLLQNAFKFTRKGGGVSLTTRVTTSRVLFEVEDECGGLPQGTIEDLFAPYSQRGEDRSGMGLGDLPEGCNLARWRDCRAGHPR